MTDHRTLLAEYANDGSEPAFRELVARYIDLVYSTAVRLVNGDTHRANDVVQTVFTDLARLARTLSPEVMLGGWLHRRTWHVATTLMRNERRRQHRERQAVEMNDFQNQSQDEFERIASLLDDAINQLGDRDRAAILLRFFEHRDLRAVGEMLGSNEDAAQKRVARAVEKLRGHFARRGVVASALAITSALAAHAVHAAPAGLASAVTTASLAGAGSFNLFTTIKILLMKKTTFMILTAAIVALIALPIIVAKAGPDKAPVTAESLGKGLVLHMTFGRDETSGRVSDSSGMGNDGTASGARWTPNGKQGGAYEFTADGDEIVVTNNPSLNPEQLTLSAWIKTKTGDHLLVAKSRVDDGQWHHVAMTFDGSEELLYVDGQVQGELTWDQPGRPGNTDFNLVIGCNRSNVDKKEHDLGKSFRGLIAEPMMWNRALSADEITFLFESQNGSPAGKKAAN
jgi:RNA polymerase sigma factor (sigma-70 family)